MVPLPALSAGNAIGLSIAFTLGHLDQTGQMTLKQKTGSNLATVWSYLANNGDRRLSGKPPERGTVGAQRTLEPSP